MRIFAAIAFVAASIALAGCGDGADDPVLTPIRETPPSTSIPATRTAPSATAAASPETTPPAAGESAEVTGLVGSVNRTTGVISINRLSGAAVDAIEVTPATVITDARSGRSAELRDVRTSDRIIARGSVDAETGTLVAVEIDYESVIPGSAPGG